MNGGEGLCGAASHLLRCGYSASDVYGRHPLAHTKNHILLRFMSNTTANPSSDAMGYCCLCGVKPFKTH